jgi:hypothetical protein
VKVRGGFINTTLVTILLISGDEICLAFPKDLGTGVYKQRKDTIANGGGFCFHPGAQEVT